MHITVYGASGAHLAAEYYAAAQRFGGLLARAGHTLVFGGGQEGLMGACARGASAEGGEIVGVAPRFFDEPGILYPHCSRFVYTETMAQRKTEMEALAEAFVVLPGGIGTFEEFFETLTLKQLGQHRKPIVLLNTLDYYDDLVSLLRKAVGGRFLSRGCLELFSLCREPEEILPAIENARSLSGGIHRLEDYHR